MTSAWYSLTSFSSMILVLAVLTYNLCSITISVVLLYKLNESSVWNFCFHTKRELGVYFNLNELSKAQVDKKRSIQF